jgi:hypothetical protein
LTFNIIRVDSSSSVDRATIKKIKETRSNQQETISKKQGYFINLKTGNYIWTLLEKNILKAWI